ncbi:DUF4865 family protein [Microlunatus flavus]|uniref:DUF4865 domain-containing protein n=1 Tax=Microlunatus flavus TaxID=1036181 RepID=A0A1H9JKV3_9ACTN|nr:DUF4865 family protein [Microlunatus flavus]SEQ87437.1 protein of unknown function [Microlunatus flavus]
MPAQLIAHYPIALPRDYDMSVIRERVQTRGSALDTRAGLVAKAYCVREAGVEGAERNEYAPFYLWGDTDAAADFLWRGTGFHGIVHDFGRPRVHTWVPEAVASGPVPADAVTHATVDVRPIAPDTDLVALAAELREQTHELVGAGEVHLSVAGIDPTHWTVVRFSTGSGPRSGPGLQYRVLHVSQPAEVTSRRTTD